MSRESRRVISATATTSDAAYSAGDQVGSLLTFSSAMDACRGAGILESLTVIDKIKVSGALMLHLFSRPVTLAADNAAFSVSAADMAYCLGTVLIAAADYKAGAITSVATKANIQLALQNDEAKSGTGLCQDIFGALMVDTGSPDYTAAANLIIRLGVRR